MPQIIKMLKFFCSNTRYTEIMCYLCIKIELMKRFISLFTILIGALIMFGASAQRAESPFAWRANVKMLSATEGEVIVKVTIAQGWHLYGMSLPKGGPKPTKFNFSASSGVKFIGNVTASEKQVTKTDKMFNLTLNYWTDTVTFRQKFKVTNASSAKIEGTVTYMGCNDNSCSPPSTFKISKAVPVKK